MTTLATHGTLRPRSSVRTPGIWGHAVLAGVNVWTREDILALSAYSVAVLFQGNATSAEIGEVEFRVVTDLGITGEIIRIGSTVDIETDPFAARTAAYIEPQDYFEAFKLGYPRLPREAADRLRQLATLTEGWDSYGAPPIDTVAIDQARRILVRACGSTGMGLPLPFIAPTLRGGVGMEWHPKSGKELLLEVSSNGEMSYLFVQPVEGEEAEDEREDVIRDMEELDNVVRAIQD